MRLALLMMACSMENLRPEPACSVNMMRQKLMDVKAGWRVGRGRKLNSSRQKNDVWEIAIQSTNPLGSSTAGACLRLSLFGSSRLTHVP